MVRCRIQCLRRCTTGFVTAIGVALLLAGCLTPMESAGLALSAAAPYSKSSDPRHAQSMAQVGSALWSAGMADRSRPQQNITVNVGSQDVAGQVQSSLSSPVVLSQGLGTGVSKAGLSRLITCTRLLGDTDGDGVFKEPDCFGKRHVFTTNDPVFIVTTIGARAVIRKLVTVKMYKDGKELYVKTLRPVLFYVGWYGWASYVEQFKPGTLQPGEYQYLVYRTNTTRLLIRTSFLVKRPPKRVAVVQENREAAAKVTESDGGATASNGRVTISCDVLD